MSSFPRCNDAGPLPIAGPFLATGPAWAVVAGGRLGRRFCTAVVRRGDRSGDVQRRHRGHTLCGEGPIDRGPGLASWRLQASGPGLASWPGWRRAAGLTSARSLDPILSGVRGGAQDDAGKGRSTEERQM